MSLRCFSQHTRFAFVEDSFELCPQCRRIVIRCLPSLRTVLNFVPSAKGYV
uniref:Uncharacterized protein n=1 Tax=Arundo donax TaxID=35708 RepID=A0A0A8Z4K3_ARUDO